MSMRPGTYGFDSASELVYIYWSFQPSPTTVEMMALISLPPCIWVLGRV